MFYGYKLENKRNSYLFIYKKNVYRTKSELKKELVKQKISSKVIDIILENVIFLNKQDTLKKLASIGILEEDANKFIIGDKS